MYEYEIIFVTFNQRAKILANSEPAQPTLNQLTTSCIFISHYNYSSEDIIYIKKLRNSDWLRAVQCNTSAKSVTPECKLHIVFLDYD